MKSVDYQKYGIVNTAFTNNIYQTLTFQCLQGITVPVTEYKTMKLEGISLWFLIEGRGQVNVIEYQLLTKSKSFHFIYLIGESDCVFFLIVEIHYNTDKVEVKKKDL
jgi:hypothetical protein